MLVHPVSSPSALLRGIGFASRTVFSLVLGVLLFAGIGPAVLPTSQARAQLATVTAEEAFADAYRLFSDELYHEAIDAFVAFRLAHPNHVHAADALYYQAESALALGQDDEAVRLFTRFEETYPAHPLAKKARLALGRYFFDAGRYDQAVGVFQSVLDDRPDAETAAKTLYWMGEASLKQERYEVAIRYYRRAAEEYRQTTTAPTALYAAGFTQVRMKQYDAAAESFELLAARYPDSPYARTIGLALAEVYYELGDYQRTVSEIERRLAVLKGETRERGLFLLAESHNHLRQSKEAIGYYNYFIEENPESPYFRQALYGLAWNYYAENVFQWAAEHFARAREGHDDELAARATYYEGVNEKLAQRPLEAIARYEEYLRRWPEGSLADKARFELAISYYEQRRWQDARSAFTAFLKAFPNSPHAGEALQLRGNTEVALGNFDEAQADFDRAVALEAAPAALKHDIVFQKAWLTYLDDKFDASATAFMRLYEQAPRSERGAEALFWAAESFFQLGNLNRARDLFQKYLEEQKGGKYVDAAHYALGWTYFRLGRYDEAARAFRTFLDEYRTRSDYVPYRTDAQLRLADSYYALKRYDEAVRIYNQVAEQAGDYALYQVGKAYTNAGDIGRATQAFRRLLQEYPDSQWAEEARYTLGYLHFQNGDYDAAIAEYRHLLERYPQDPLAAKAQYGIGDALFNAGRTAEAVEAYTVVLDRYPSSPLVADAAAGIQYALAAEGDAAQANQIIDDFAARHPDSPIVDELRFRQAEVRYQSGDIEGAADAFRQFIRTSRSEQLLPEAYFYLGTISADRGRTQEAESYLSSVVNNYPQSPRFEDAARRLGQLYLATRRNQEALGVYQQLERRRSGNSRTLAEARYGQGVALLNLGRTQEAERLLRDAISTAPDAPEVQPAYLGLARVYEASRRNGDAIALYRQLAERNRDEVGAEALYRLGALLLQSGDARGAIDELSRLPVLFNGYVEWVAQGYVEQARAFHSIGQNGEAARLYERVIEEYSGTPYAETARQERADL